MSPALVRISLLAALGGSLLGFAIARLTPVQRDAGALPAPAISSKDLSVEKSTSAEGQAALPKAEFRNAKNFHGYVRRLQEMTGADKGFAQWLALTVLAKQDFDAAFRLANEEKLLSPWATGAALLNPSAALKACQTLPLMDQQAVIYGLFDALGRVAPGQGLALFASLPADAAVDAAFSFFKNWADVSRQAAGQAAAALKSTRMRSRALAGVFHVWGLEDRRGMLEWAATQEPSVGRSAFRASYEGIGMRDPEEMLDLAQEFPKMVDWMMLAEIGRALAGKGPSGWEAISRLPPGSMRNEIIMRAGSTMAAIDPATAWKLFQTLDPADQNYFARLSADSLAKVAPREIAAMFAGGRLGSEYLSSIMRGWSQSDAPAALTWSVEHLGGRQKSNAMGDILREWATRDVPSALAALGSLPPGMRVNLMPDLVRTWSASNPQAAFAWAQSQSNLDRPIAVEAVISGWAVSDPTAAGKALAAQAATGMESAYDQVAWRLTDKNPAGAMDWAAHVTDLDMAGRVAGRITYEWGHKDAASAAELLATLQPGMFRDHAVSGFVGSIHELDPSTAATWANSIGDTTIRQTNLRRTLQAWKAVDRDAAAAFVRTLPADTVKAEMLRLVNE